MATTNYIDAVRLSRPHGNWYPHIEQAHVINVGWLTCEQVIYNIRYLGWEYRTYAPNVPQAKVIVHQCPHCYAGDYLTTEPDSTPYNNLLDLPEY